MTKIYDECMNVVEMLRMVELKTLLQEVYKFLRKLWHLDVFQWRGTDIM